MLGERSKSPDIDTLERFEDLLQAYIQLEFGVWGRSPPACLPALALWLLRPIPVLLVFLLNLERVMVMAAQLHGHVARVGMRQWRLNELAREKRLVLVCR